MPWYCTVCNEEMTPADADEALMELEFHVMIEHPEEVPRGKCRLCDEEVPSDGPLAERLDLLRFHVEEQHPGTLR